MSADRKTEVYLDNLPASDREKCSSCSARGRTYTSQIPWPLCDIAKLQKVLGRKPRVGQIGRARIDITNVPDNCPNGY